MKLILDTEKATLSEEEEDGEIRHFPLYSREAFERLSRHWVRIGWNQKYQYTFTWMGRPVIQLPEDMVRVQEAIYRVKPDVIINTNKIVYGTEKYDEAFMAKYIQPLGFQGQSGRVWAGQTDDGFYVDIGRIFDLANLLGGTAHDNVAGYNNHSIALEIPTTDLTVDGKPPTAGASDDNTIGVWASASRRQVRILHRGGGESNFGSWVQVSRLGLPLVNEAIIGLQDKDKYNRTKPAKDVANFGAYFLNPVIVRDAEAVGIYKALGVPQDVVDSLKHDRLDIIDTINLKASGHDIPLSATGDVLRVDLGLDSRFPNGRPIPYGAAPNKEQADVTDVLLSVLLSKGTVAVSDGAQSNDVAFQKQFPYLGVPHEGFQDGHGKAAP